MSKTIKKVKKHRRGQFGVNTAEKVISTKKDRSNIRKSKYEPNFYDEYPIYY